MSIDYSQTSAIQIDHFINFKLFIQNNLQIFMI